MKHKLFLFIFGAFSIVKWLMSIYFQNCFVMRHVWIIYLLYFVLITGCFPDPDSHCDSKTAGPDR